MWTAPNKKRICSGVGVIVMFMTVVMKIMPMSLMITEMIMKMAMMMMMMTMIMMMITIDVQDKAEEGAAGGGEQNYCLSTQRMHQGTKFVIIIIIIIIIIFIIIIKSIHSSRSCVKLAIDLFTQDASVANCFQSALPVANNSKTANS